LDAAGMSSARRLGRLDPVTAATTGDGDDAIFTPAMSASIKAASSLRPDGSISG
jgi:hypothetical protein